MSRPGKAHVRRAFGRLSTFTVALDVRNGAANFRRRWRCVCMINGRRWRGFCETRV
jgi:transposase